MYYEEPRTWDEYVQQQNEIQEQKNYCPNNDQFRALFVKDKCYNERKIQNDHNDHKLQKCRNLIKLCVELLQEVSE